MSTDKKYTPEFENQSWEKMSELLDKEMPQKKKKRFPFFFILGAILLLIVSYFAYHVVTDKKADPILVASTQNHNENQDARSTEKALSLTHPKAETTNPNLINHEKNSDTTRDALISIDDKKPPLSNASIAQEDHAKSAVSSPVNNFNNTSSSAKTIQAKTLQKNKTESVINEPYLSTPSLQTAELISSITNNKTSKKTKIEQPSTKLKDGINARSYGLLAALQKETNLLKLHIRTLPDLSPPLYEPIEVIEQPMDRWGFGIGAAYASNYDRNTHGPGVITRASFNLSKSWAIEGGIGIFRHSVSGEEQAIEDASKIIQSSTEPIINAGIGLFEQDTLAITTYLSSVKNQTQVVSSLGVNRSFSRFFIATGIKNRYTLSRTIAFTDPTLMDDNEAFLDVTENLKSETFLRNQFYSAYIGIGYTPYEHLSFRIEADFSGQSYTTTSSNTTINNRTSFLQAEMAYRF